MPIDAETPKLENMALAYSSGKYDRPGYEQVLSYEQSIGMQSLQFGSHILHGLSSLLISTAYGEDLTNTQKAENHHNIGKSYYNKRDYKNALNEYELAVKYDPYNSRYINNLGVILTKIKCYDRAIEVFKKGIDINSSDSRLYLNLGKALMEKGRELNDRDILITAIESYKMVILIENKDSMLFIIARNAISAIEVKDFGMIK